MPRKSIIKKKTFHFCTFCGKDETRVDVLITSPTANICDICVAECAELITKEKMRKDQK